MSYRADKQEITAHTDGRTDGRTQTIPEGQNWPQVMRLKLECWDNFIPNPEIIHLFSRDKFSLCHGVKLMFIVTIFNPLASVYSRGTRYLTLPMCLLWPHEGGQCPKNLRHTWRIRISHMKVSEWVIYFNGLFENSGHRGPYSPYKPRNYSLYVEIIIFPHIDNTQFIGYN